MGKSIGKATGKNLKTKVYVQRILQDRFLAEEIAYKSDRHTCASRDLSFVYKFLSKQAIQNGYNFTQGRCRQRLPDNRIERK